MNPFLMSLPTVLASLIILYFVLRALRRSQITDAAHEAEYRRKMAEYARRDAERERTEATRRTRSQAELVVKLDLSDEERLPDLRLATQQAQPLLSALSQQEQSLGGLGLTLTAAKVERGSVRLTLSPIERSGSAARVRRVAEEMNAALSPLPPGVTAAHADILAV
jgi:hypothetical protein